MLENNILDYIKKSKMSYSKIISEVSRLFGVNLSKSLISYYKRSKNRERKINIFLLSPFDRDWLNGLFLADGCKFKEKDGHYTIKIALDRNKDKCISVKLIRILDKIGCKYSTRSHKNVMVVRIYSKMLFESLPTKNILFKPKDDYAFLAGLIDGDGSKKGNSAILVQYKNIDTMKYLSQTLEFKGHSYRVKTNFGYHERKQYYIPKRICDVIKKRFLSIKLCN